MRLSRACILLPALLLSFPALAEQKARCAVDAFGNTVCMDQDGVTSIRPRSASDKDIQGDEAVGDEKVGKDAETTDLQRRCAVDDFGNKVCSD